MFVRQLALAGVVATCVPVMAQSSVTIYGRVDLGLFHQNSGSTPTNGGISPAGPAANMWQVRQGSAGRIGFRGIEDLGGGLEAGFQMEHRFDADTGLAHNPFWEARSFVYAGAPKQWGTVYAGREYIPAFWVALKADPWGLDTVATPGPRHLLANYGVPVSGIRSDNTIGLRSAIWNGFSSNVAWSAGEGTRSNTTGVNLEYTLGPLYVGTAFDSTTSQQKMWMAAASYDFGVVRTALLYARSKVNNVESSNVSLTARIPVSTHLVKLAVSRLNPEGPGNTNTKLSAGYEHFLSKRTSLLANIGSAKQPKLTRTTMFDLSIKHNF
ncbi:porin [Acidovorax sp. LjRoot194]|uniref:porin n=1 Tax=Acidovorax sp. LjRoot194 TaxID=3342280 RepID=UPI003ECDC552